MSLFWQHRCLKLGLKRIAWFHVQPFPLYPLSYLNCKFQFKPKQPWSSFDFLSTSMTKVFPLLLQCWDSGTSACNKGKICSFQRSVCLCVNWQLWETRANLGAGVWSTLCEEAKNHCTHWGISLPNESVKQQKEYKRYLHFCHVPAFENDLLNSLAYFDYLKVR